MTGKMFVIGGLMVLVWIATMLVFVLTEECENRQLVVQDEISRGWGPEQNIGGPFLVYPYSRSVINANPPRSVTEYLVVRPTKLVSKADFVPEVRSRGIFETVVYKSLVTFDANFAPPTVPVGVVLQRPFLFIPSDFSARPTKILLAMDDTTVTPESRTDLSQEGIGFNLPTVDVRQGHLITLSFELKGSGSFEIDPSGLENEVNFSSPWNEVSFSGQALPDSREIDEKGFNAFWQVTHDEEVQIVTSVLASEPSEGVGVKFFQGSDLYTQINRTLKYSILFIALTFIAFFMFEILSGLRVHPFQYVLVGAAIALFYLLLLSLAEIIGFLPAYSIAALVVVVMISTYSAKVLKTSKRASTIASLLVTAYLLLYANLLLEEWALLFGSVVLTLVLASLMYLTRNIDWYSIKNSS